MRLYNNDKWCKADKGKIFVLTEKGKNECASYNHKTVGKPVDEYEDESPLWAVEKGYCFFKNKDVKILHKLLSTDVLIVKGAYNSNNKRIEKALQQTL